MKIPKLKKVLTMAACAVMLILPCQGMLSSAVEGMEDSDGELYDGNFTYEMVDGSYTIIKCDESSILKEIPELRNGYAVTAIGDNAFSNCTFITELTIPDTVTSIGDSAFAGCTSLKSVTLPKRLKNMANGVFMSCTRLESIDIPDTVDTIESYAFYNCTSLEKVELPGSLSTIKPMAFAGCAALSDIDASNTSAFTVEDGILYNKSKENIFRGSVDISGELHIEEGVKSIEAGAFSSCGSMEAVFVPSSVTYIGDGAFSYCPKLKKVGFEEGLQTIAPIAFKYCDSIETISFPTTLREIGDGAFFYCSSLSRVILNEGLETVGEGAFTACPQLKQVIIPQSLVNISPNAFGYDIKSGDYALEDDFKMSVYSGSAGEKYAKANKISFSTVDKSIKQYAFIVAAVAVLAAVIVLALVLMRRGKKTAPASVRRAEKLEKERQEEDNYEKIMADDDTAEPETEE